MNQIEQIGGGQVRDGAGLKEGQGRELRWWDEGGQSTEIGQKRETVESSLDGLMWRGEGAGGGAGVAAYDAHAPRIGRWINEMIARNERRNRNRTADSTQRWGELCNRKV